MLASIGSLWSLVSTALLAPKVFVTVPGVGRIRGSGLQSTDIRRPIHGFWGIPYAASPSGHLRFAPPHPRPPLNSGSEDVAYDASLLSYIMSPPMCPQLVKDRGVLGVGGSGEMVVRGKEDCLTLGVFTPAVRRNPHKLLPVAVFIHGGAFRIGSYSAIGPQHLLDKDVVLVTLSYRLGALGFLCLDQETAPGNLGLLDQILGLQWVKKHIRYFGGDPSQVTLMGESAGSASVSFLMMSPLASGLFHRAVMMSGTWPAIWSYNKEPYRSADLIARELKCPTTDRGQLLHCLRSRSLDDVVRGTEQVRKRINQQGRDGTSLTAPCSQQPGPHQVVPQDLNMTDQITFLNRVPVMIGSVRDEGTLFTALLWNQMFLPRGRLRNRDFFREQFLVDGLTVLFDNATTRQDRIVQELKAEYFHPQELGQAQRILPGLIALAGRFTIKEPSYEYSQLLRAHVPTYLYSFDHLGDNTVIGFILGDNSELVSGPPLPRGVNHGDDLLYLFDVGVIQLEGRDNSARRSMVSAMSSFIMGGSPYPGLSSSGEEFLSIQIKSEIRRDYTCTFRRGYK